MKIAVAVGSMLMLSACGIIQPGVPNMCEIARMPGSLSCQNGDKNFEAVAAPAAAAPAPEPPKEVAPAPEPPKEAPAAPDKPGDKPGDKPSDKPGHGHGDKNHDHDHKGGKDK